MAALALIVTLINTLPDSGGDTQGTSRNGDTVHGTPVTPPDQDSPEVGWGFTHTQYSADEGSPAATERVESLLQDAGGMPQDQALMGWGADNPEPVKGRYDFDAMDRRIDFIRKSGGTPVPPPLAKRDRAPPGNHRGPLEPLGDGPMRVRLRRY